MYSFFTSPSKILYTVYKSGSWNSVRTNLKKNLGRFQLYYRDHTNRVKSDHYLVRVLQSVGVTKNIEADRYYENIMNVINRHSMAMQFTSELSKGLLRRGVLYGHNVDEIWIADTSEFDYTSELSGWQFMQPVRILKHPRSDVSLIPLDGYSSSEESGTAVILVHLPKLFMMYYAFYKEELRKEQALSNIGYVRKSVEQFVFRYVLTNAMASHLDVAVFNRYCKIAEKLQVGTAYRRIPMVLPDYTSSLDLVLYDIAEKIHPELMDIHQWLMSIPAVTEKDQASNFILPDFPPIRNVRWALENVTSTLLSGYLGQSKGHGRKKNGLYVTSAVKLLNAIHSDNTYRTMMSYKEYTEFMDILTRFSQMEA
jgi:hypothetical protein